VRGQSVNTDWDEEEVQEKSQKEREKLILLKESRRQISQKHILYTLVE
jgi:hypothetical protein